MKLAVTVALSLVVAVAGCRAIIGIEDLEQAPPNNGNHDGGKPDSGGPGPGPGQDGGKQAVDASLADSCRARGGACRMCCKSGSSLHETFEGNGPGTPCICGQCSQKCSPNGTCTPGPLPGSSPGVADDCIICTDDTLKSGVCEGACNGDPECLAGLKCMESCP